MNGNDTTVDGTVKSSPGFMPISEGLDQLIDRMKAGCELKLT